MARPATPPEPNRPNPSSRPSGFRLPASIQPADVRALVERCLEQTGGARSVDCDGADLVDPRLAAVDAIARVALATRRSERPFRLEHASPGLIELLRLCGLDEALRARGELG